MARKIELIDGLTMGDGRTDLSQVGWANDATDATGKPKAEKMEWTNGRLMDGQSDK